MVTYLEAQRIYNDNVKAYHDTAVRHRRSMLALNTALGSASCRDRRCEDESRIREDRPDLGASRA